MRSTKRTVMVNCAAETAGAGRRGGVAARGERPDQSGPDRDGAARGAAGWSSRTVADRGVGSRGTAWPRRCRSERRGPEAGSRPVRRCPPGSADRCRCRRPRRRRRLGDRGYRAWGSRWSRRPRRQGPGPDGVHRTPLTRGWRVGRWRRAWTWTTLPRETRMTGGDTLLGRIPFKGSWSRNAV